MLTSSNPTEHRTALSGLHLSLRCPSNGPWGPTSKVETKLNESAASIQVVQFPDLIPTALLFAVTIIVMLVFIEIGFRLGSRPQDKTVKAQSTQVRAIMGVTLGLLAFMLAFTFATAQSHFEIRVANLAEEARQAHNAFLHADLLDEPHRTRARKLLRTYIGERITLEKITETDQWGEVLTFVKNSENLQRELWDIGLANERDNRAADQNRLQRSPFMVSVVGIIDIHNFRLQAELANRISWVVWVTLNLTALLGMLITGYHAGLIGRRSPIATFSLAIAFSAVMMLITDLDRPMTSMFKISDQSLVILAANMDEMLLSD